MNDKQESQRLEIAQLSRERLESKLSEAEDRVLHLAGKWRDATVRYRVAEEDADRLAFRVRLDAPETERQRAALSQHADALKARVTP